MSRRVGLRVALGMAIVFAVAITAYAQDPEGRPSPDYPRPQFWWRKPSAGVSVMCMSSDLREIADAFGRGDLQRTCSLAETFLDSHDASPDLSAEAAGFLVEALLAQGHTDAARNAARELQYEEGTARVTREEALVAGLDARLFSIARRSRQLPVVRRARRDLACLRLRTESGHAALSEYWLAIDGRPDSDEAEDAVFDIWTVVEQVVGAQAAVKQMQYVAERHRDAAAGGMAHYAIARLQSSIPVPLLSVKEFDRIVREWPNSEAAELASGDLRRSAAVLAGGIAELNGWGKHGEVLEAFELTAPYLDSLDSDALSRTLQIVLAAARRSDSLGEQALGAIVELSQAPGCQLDSTKAALVAEANGLVLLQLRRRSAAMQTWQTLARSHVASGPVARVRLCLGLHSLTAGNPTEALHAFDSALEQARYLTKQEHAQALRGKGAALEALGRPSEAALEYNGAKRLLSEPPVTDDRQ